MKPLRAILRLFAFFTYTVWIVVRIIVSGLFVRDHTRFGIHIRQRYARVMLPVLGVRTLVEGELPKPPCLLMGNHRSYLDPVVVARDAAMVPVAKAELNGWPVIGYGAKASGVIFLKRESPGSRKMTLQAIADKAREGFSVVLFPEGTTHSNPTTIPFRRGGFQLAANNGIPVVPLALDFRYAADNWIDDDTFLGHFMRRFGEKRIDFRMAYGPQLYSTDADTLMQETRAWIDAKLAQWHGEGWNS